MQGSQQTQEQEVEEVIKTLIREMEQELAMDLDNYDSIWVPRDHAFENLTTYRPIICIALTRAQQRPRFSDRLILYLFDASRRSAYLDGTTSSNLEHYTLAIRGQLVQICIEYSFRFDVL